MYRAGYKVTGLNAVVRDLKAMGVEVDDLKTAFSKIAARGAAEAAAAAPAASGRLRTTIRGNRAKSKAVVAAGRASVPYAGPINYGWPARNIAATGFMQTADQRMRPIALDLLEQEINHTIRKRGLT